MSLTDKDIASIKFFYDKLGGRVSAQTLSTIIRHKLGVTVDAKEVSLVLANLPVGGKAIAHTPVVDKTKANGVGRNFCIDLINAMKANIKDISDEYCVNKLLDNGISFTLFLSDLHFGETIEINGKTIFNFDIAIQRLTSLIEQTMEMARYDIFNIDELNIILGGDIIDGELIYPGHPYNTEENAYQQLQRTALIIWEQLSILSDSKLFPVINVYCVPGNHGRTTKFHHDMSNWDNVVYFALQLLASKADASIPIIVNTPHQMWMDFNIRHWTAHLRHIGVPQAVTAVGVRKVSAWMDNHNADILFYGHYHCPDMFSFGTRRIFKNGSLKPVDDYAERLGFLEGTGQWLVGTTDKELVAFSKILLP